MSRYLIFALVSAVTLTGSISSTSVAVAFPVIVTSFGASLVMAGWVLSSNQLVATAVMPITGKVSDVFGGKRTFMTLVVIFMVGSVLCALAPNIQTLIFARVIQAIGSGGFMPSSAGIVAAQFPNARRQSLGFLTTIMPIGQIVGPIFGGWVTHIWGWQAVFWINVPLGIISLVVAAMLLPAGVKQESRIDLVGAALLTGTLVTFMLGLSGLGSLKEGPPGVSTWGLLAASVALMIMFVRHEGAVKGPIIELEALTRRPFRAANVFNFIFGACAHTTSALIPLYAVTVYGMSTLNSGLILAPKSIGMMLAAMVTSYFIVRWGYRKPILTGTVLVALGLSLLGAEIGVLDMPGIRMDGAAFLLIVMAVFGLGLGATAPAANNACIELMPDRVATISGIRGMFRQSGGAIAITVASILLQNIGNMADGFRIIFVGLAIVLVMTIPFVFVMTPKLSDDRPLES